MRARSVAVCIAVFLSIVSAHACSCIGRPMCGAMQPDGIRFLGEVMTERAIRVPMYVNSRVFISNRVFRIRVLESFSGAERVGDEVDVRTGTGGGDCGYDFVVGHRYLVDAYARPGTDRGNDVVNILRTSICSGTQEEIGAAVSLRELRTALAQGRQPDLHGTVRSGRACMYFPVSRCPQQR